MRSMLMHMLSAVLLLVMAVFVLRIEPDFWPPAVLLSLQWHAGLALVAAALVCFWLKPGLLPGGLLVAALAIFGQALLLHRATLPPAATAASATATEVKVISFNILGDNLENGAAISDFLISSGADIAYVMEAEPVSRHLDALGKVYPYRIGCGEHTPTCDLMVLSRYPLSKVFVGTLSDLRKDRFAMAEVTIGGAPLRLVAAHVSKPYFDDYHQEELEEVVDAINDTDGPLVLAGDFNASSLAPDMQRLLRQTGMSAVGREPATWPIRLGALGVAIDHIYIRPPLQAVSLSRLPSAFGSNHYGLQAELLLPKP